jgi:hypothetical protein
MLVLLLIPPYNHSKKPTTKSLPIILKLIKQKKCIIIVQ